MTSADVQSDCCSRGRHQARALRPRSTSWTRSRIAETLDGPDAYGPMPDPITRLNLALEGRYRIESELGKGGMATVYLADDLKHERKVALKVRKREEDR